LLYFRIGSDAALGSNKNSAGAFNSILGGAIGIILTGTTDLNTQSASSCRFS